MNLLDKIKSLLNIESDESRPTDRTASTDVSSYESNSSNPSGNGTVDTKSDSEETDAQSETDPTIPEVEEAESDPDVPEDHADDGSETVVTAGANTDPGGESDVETDAETVSDADTGEKLVENEPETNDTEPATENAETDAIESESVDVIKGVGATYADRLAGAGIETVDELAAADPAAVAQETEISPKRIERWVGRAEHR